MAAGLAYHGAVPVTARTCSSTTFGTFWAAESAGLGWPGEDWAPVWLGALSVAGLPGWWLLPVAVVAALVSLRRAIARGGKKVSG